MKAKEILELGIAIEKCSNLRGLKFIYALAKNSILIKEFSQTFENERIKLNEEFAEKNENGDCVLINNNNYKIKEMGLFNKKIKELLDSEIEIDFYKISESDLPEDITSGQLIGIIPIIIHNERTH